MTPFATPDANNLTVSLRIAVVCLAALVTTSIVRGGEPVRVAPLERGAVREISMDGEWDFLPLDAPPAADELDAAAPLMAKAEGWHPLAVPQFLNRYAWWLDISEIFVAADRARLAALPFDAEKTRAGWYRRTIELPAADGAPPDVSVRFEGVAMISKVWCNGESVGGHIGMFGAFDCNLTNHLKWGAANTLLVYAERGDDVKNADDVLGVAVTVAVTRGMLASLNHGMFGGFGRGAFAKFLGIWQPVTMKISPPGGRIADVFFRPELDGHRIEYTLESPTGKPAAGRIVCTLTDLATGEKFHTDTAALEAPVAVTGAITAHGLAPKLWTPDDPNLYELVVEWRAADDHLVDRWTHKVGYRTVTVKGTQLYLNGRPYWTRGAGMPVYGYKPNDEATARGFLSRMHQGNQMVTRSGCNPWNDLWYGIADEEGIGVASEGVRPWALMGKTPPPGKALLEHWKQEQVESVRQYRNHPSILYYCISNEGLQGDAANPEKLAIFKDIIDAVRAVDPTRPICQTSGEPDVAGNADIEDVHSYWGWYEPSSYVYDYDIPRRGLHAGDGRAFINKETAVPYQDTDTGGVHPAYVERYSAHAWVGEMGAEGGDPSYFAEHVRAGTKLKTEKLRRQRKDMPTAGMLLFANTTWIGDVLTAAPDRWKPFPVWDDAALALAPVLAGLTTTQRVFRAGDLLKTNAFVVNDDAKFRDLTNLSLKTEIVDARGNLLVSKETSMADESYFQEAESPLTLQIPTPQDAGPIMAPATIRLALSANGEVMASNRYPIRIATPAWTTGAKSDLTVSAPGCGPGIIGQLKAMGMKVRPAGDSSELCDVIVLGPQAKEIDPETARRNLKPGGSLLVLEQGAAAARFCPDIYPKQPAANTGKDNELDHFMFEKADAVLPATMAVQGEFVEMLGWKDGDPLFDGLDAMDWKWWACGEDKPALACIATHRIDPSHKDVVVIGRYLPPHFYWTGDLKKVYESKLTWPVFAVRRPWGTLIVCELAIERAISHDPRAARTLRNLLTQPVRGEKYHQ